MPQADSIFGEIPGYPVGSRFDGREEVRLAGLHRHGEAGISGHYRQGADAIVVSGGYKDDTDDGRVIVYTGHGGREGGRQVRDQTLTQGNLALARSEEFGLPVRVIRGAEGKWSGRPSSGYRYDGLFVVVNHWHEPSQDGPLIWRYVLEQADVESEWQNEPPTPAPPIGTPEPGRKIGVVQRVIRNTEVTQWVKNKHDFACQFCGTVLESATGRYAEGAHIRALGAPHNGPDVPGNVLCLCPNDHVLFDKGALFIEDGWVKCSSDGASVYQLRLRDGHEIDWSNAAYHREHFATV